MHSGAKKEESVVTAKAGDTSESIPSEGNLETLIDSAE